MTSKNLNFRKLLKQARPYLKMLLRIGTSRLSRLSHLIKSKITAWWQVALAVVFAIVFLYYPIGGYMINSIDTSPYHAKSRNTSLYTIDSLSYLINREVHHHIWTPNLPVLFPSYFLDNMPNFQTGIISAVAHTAGGLKQMSFTTSASSPSADLDEAARLLRYPADIWLFSKQNRLTPATSSNTQYKKGRRHLNNFNNDIASGKIMLSRDASNFVPILEAVRRDLLNLIKRNSDHIRENNTNLLDFKADDVFYYAYGKLYAYSQIASSLSLDFKETLVSRDIYQQWTSFIRLLTGASEITPLIVRNGSLSSGFAPNHLAYLNDLTAQALTYLDAILCQLH
ncbi:MAG: DUF2333 family protein [Alphaproteobacteria bacterium]|nr:DUF2333 family protein [Alphaproteobacteria bacterium]MBQ9234903.1 DUF2333 family protein [Alphaproteobacteria bacterium]